MSIKHHITRKKINYLPFYDTWDKRVIITEIYNKPDKKEWGEPKWYLKEYSNKKDDGNSFLSSFFGSNTTVTETSVSGWNGKYDKYSPDGEYHLTNFKREKLSRFTEWSQTFEINRWDSSYGEEYINWIEEREAVKEGIEPLEKKVYKIPKICRFEKVERRWSRGPPLFLYIFIKTGFV